ncbi:MAG: hypothetical protein V8Q40_07850 [Anaerosacchariphilus sp.]
MGLMKPRVSSYVDRGNELIAKGKTKQAMNLVSHGLQYYSERVIDSISPYAKNDAGLIVLVLRHLADEVRRQPRSKGTGDWYGEVRRQTFPAGD